VNHEQDQGSGIVSFLMGVGIGAAVAAAAAVLYAPKSGADSRRELSSAAQELRSRTDKVLEQVRGATHDLGERVKQDVDAAMAAAREAAAARRTEIERKVHGE
jgi:gas vesicle protein